MRLKKFDFFKFLSGYYMRGKFAGTFENRIRNLQATLKETSVQPQSECDDNRRRQWEQAVKRGQVKFLWAFCHLQERKRNICFQRIVAIQETFL